MTLAKNLLVGTAFAIPGAGLMALIAWPHLPPAPAPEPPASQAIRTIPLYRPAEPTPPVTAPGPPQAPQAAIHPSPPPETPTQDAAAGADSKGFASESAPNLSDNYCSRHGGIRIEYRNGRSWRCEYPRGRR